MTACDPQPGAAASCVAGFHCSPDGLCDAQCTVGGGQCGDGYTCTADGYCVDDGSGSGSGAPDASCPAVNFTPIPTTPSIGLVLDQSGSMYTGRVNGQATTGNSCANDPQCRYVVMREALVGTTGVVTQLESKAYFGSNLYTCNGNADAILNTPRALNNAAAIRTAIDSKTLTVGSNTPTAAAINAMVATFAANPPPAGSPPVIVLATDGSPNSCNQNLTQAQADQQSEDAAGASFAAGVPVYVLAIGQMSGHFQDVANRGQGSTTNVTYYPVNNAAALATAFQTIINGVISCDLSLTSGIDATSAMNGTVTVNGMMLTYGVDWILVNGNIIRVQGAACNSLKNSPNPAVSATFPCGSVIF